MATQDPNFGSEPENPTPENDQGFISRAEFERILAERDAKHAEAMEAAKSRIPQQMVAAHAGGPGSDNHQISWSLAEQEASRRGETLDHWKM